MRFPASSLPESVRFAGPDCICAASLEDNKNFSEKFKKDIYLFRTFVETAENVCRGKYAAVLKG